MKLHSKTIVASVACALLMVGCATQQQNQTTPAKPAPAPAPKATAPATGYGPHYTTYVADGAKYTRGSIAYPSGLRDGSGLLLEKTVPAEVQAGVPFSYIIKVSNLAPCEVRDVTVGSPGTELEFAL